MVYVLAPSKDNLLEFLRANSIKKVDREQQTRCRDTPPDRSTRYPWRPERHQARAEIVRRPFVYISALTNTIAIAQNTAPQASAISPACLHGVGS